MFVVLYDFSDMPPNAQTFLRQRTFSVWRRACHSDEVNALPTCSRLDLLEVYNKVIIVYVVTLSTNGLSYMAISLAVSSPKLSGSRTSNRPLEGHGFDSHCGDSIICSELFNMRTGEKKFVVVVRCGLSFVSQCCHF